MISKYLTIVPAVAALLLGAGCSNDDMDGVLADGPVAAQVTADISDGQAVSRVSITSTSGNSASFTENDEIHVVAAGSETYDYTLQSDGSTWTADTPYYFQDFTSVSFRGWYAVPTVAETEAVTETEAGTESSISIDTSTQTTDATTGWNAWDILATPAVSAYAISPTVRFTGVNAFQHVMSQVTFTFTAGDGVSDLEALKGYTLKNLITDAAFDTQACTLAAGSTTGDITQSVSATSETTELACTPVILVPQDVDGKLTLEVTYNDLVYTAELSLPSSATALTAGTHYTFTVSIDNTGLTIGSATIETWTTIPDRAGEATFDSIDYTYTTDASGVRSYTVYSEIGLRAWNAYVQEGNYSTNCTLAKDITLTSEWTAVGTSSNTYNGTFDGNGYTITNLTIINSSAHQGLISFLGSEGVVKNLALEDVNISITNGVRTGAVVGRNYGTVINCYTSGIVSSGSGTGSWDTGGVVGNNCGTVTACYSTATVSTYSYSGGVVGYNEGGSVTACYSTGTISGTQWIGGVVGCNDNGTVTACYSTGTVTGTSCVGGVVGWNKSSVTTCYWNNSLDSGIGTGDDGETTYVDGNSVTWESAATTMNTALIGSGWQYTGDGTSDPPLTLVTE